MLLVQVPSMSVVQINYTLFVIFPQMKVNTSTIY